jgi:hypothetical protein
MSLYPIPVQLLAPWARGPGSVPVFTDNTRFSVSQGRRARFCCRGRRDNYYMGEKLRKRLGRLTGSGAFC